MFSNLLKKLNLSGGRSFLGVDIGTTSIKIVEVSGGRGGAEMANYAIFETYGHLERINTALQTSSLKLYDREIAEYLKLIIKKAGFSSRRVIASLPSFLVFSTLIEIPQMSSEDVQKTIGFKAKQYIPLPMSSVTLDWMKVGEKTGADGTKVQQIFLISVPNEEVAKYKNIFQLSGLNVIALEVDGFSLARALTSDKTEPVLIIDIGSRSTAFLVAKKGLLRFISQSDFAGASLTQSLSSGLGVNLRRAEDLKRQKGLAGLDRESERELSTLLLPLLDVIINEGKRALDNYENNYQEKVSGVILAGGGSNLLGVENYFKSKFDLPISKANPFENVGFPERLEPIIGNLGPSLAVSLGLGIKSFS